MVEYTVGIDLGGTFIKAAAVDREGRVLARARAATEVPAGPERVLENLGAAVREVRVAVPAGRLAGVGAGVPGILDPAEGVVVKSPNFPDWDGFPLRRRLREVLALPVTLENDANAAAVGEQWVGAARGMSDFIFVTLGTGVGGGIVLDGRLRRGPRGKAGEFGHIVVEPGGVRCGCGGWGCVEAYASAPGIVRMAREAMAAGAPTILATEAALTCEGLFAAAAAGDAAARAAFERAGRYLALAMVDAINLLDVSRFVLGGGVSHAFPAFIGPLRDELSARLFGIEPARIEVVRAACGEDAGILGAARLAWEAGAVAAGPRG